MRKICIVTNYRSTTNYGALLQAYALNQKLASTGYYVRTLLIKRDKDSSNIRHKQVMMKLLHENNIHAIILMGWMKVKKEFLFLLVKKKLGIRRQAVERFRLSIPHTDAFRIQDLPRLQEQFDIFIAGSDQIFRPNRITCALQGEYWLTMVHAPAVKASYAASMGIDKLPDFVEPKAASYLKDFDFISIREESAAEYFKQLTGRNDIITSIDPVFLISKTQWQQMEKPYTIGGEYLLIYMIYGTRKLLNSIKNFAKAKGLKIVIFPSMAYVCRFYEKGIGDVEVYDASPEQFLFLLDHAAYVFTDSFHGTAFSTIFHKRVFVSHANLAAYSRIQNLLSKLGISGIDIPAEGLPFQEYTEHYEGKGGPDWEAVDEKIAEERRCSELYLQNILRFAEERNTM